ncbi:unnamed protein product [Penicillium pancosmium]
MSSPKEIEEIKDLWKRHQVAYPIDQSTYLSSNSIRLPRVKTKLMGLANFNEWENNVETILITKKIFLVISNEIARPCPTGEKAEIWEKVSTEVANWLMNNISPNIRNSIKNKKRNSVFADDTYKAIAEECLGYGVWMLSEICVTHPDAASKVLQSIRDKKKDETNFDRKDFLKAAKDAKTYCFASFLS